MENKIENQLNEMDNWLKEEIASPTMDNPNYVRKPALKLEEGKIVSFIVDFTEKFRKKEDTKDGKTKIQAIIPVVHKGEEKILWFNVKNPLYQQICKLGLEGQTTFKVSTTGNQSNTRYTIATHITLWFLNKPCTWIRA